MSVLTNTNIATEEMAERLLGCLLVKQADGVTTSGWIVETEAYVGVLDEACHSYNGKNTPRMKAMFEQAGTIYIYKMHTHQLLNVVTKERGNPQAVLIRAIEPYEGENIMEERRQKKGVDVTNGPGKLTKAMGITMKDYGTSVLEPSLYIDTSHKKIPLAVERSKRIGIPNKGKWTDSLLRFTVKGNPYLTKGKEKLSVDNGWSTMLD
ncbi:DNA-3-methyladenine glycosylase [Alkalibacterium sp. 20]|uniref:DNA-3-methyladenine glycosylase n=1 Tax=Alkalibacterium sp. 20 TaxID=1798803 RepID=UPI0009003C8B|nr:DNA-3-methyladenine glycosylase [Alkalibacterium sp. 20]OJF92655.1 3-methyladenine DNA glycosylase [Alkalibacterium sp. 20]